MPPLIAALAVLAVARLTRLITTDYLTVPARDRLGLWLARRGHVRLLYLLHCPWCASMWVAPPVLLVAYLVGDNPVVFVGLASLAASYLTGWLAGRDVDADPGPDGGGDGVGGDLPEV